jgi:hypothetical protein
MYERDSGCRVEAIQKHSSNVRDAVTRVESCGKGYCECVEKRRNGAMAYKTSMYYIKICIGLRTYYRYRRVRKRHDWHSRMKDHLAFRLRGNDLVLQRYQR